MTSEQAMKTMPKSIRIGGHLFKIELRNNHFMAGERNFGMLSVTDQTIILQEKFPSSEKLIDTFWHEVLHAVWWVWGIKDKDGEERIISVLSSALLQLQIANPGVFMWMRKVLYE